MIKISDADFNLLLNKLPLLLNYCKIPATDTKALNAARRITLTMRKLRKNQRN